MNVFMGYNPLATKQAKVTVWVCEQDGETPVAPSNPSEGDCFVVYATDEAMLSNTPTSKKTYTNGDWADAEGGGGGSLDYPTFTIDEETEEVTCDKTYSECATMCENSGIAENAWFCLISPNMGTMKLSDGEDAYITVSVPIRSSVLRFWYLANGTITWEEPK